MKRILLKTVFVLFLVLLIPFSSFAEEAAVEENWNEEYWGDVDWGEGDWTEEDWTEDNVYEDPMVYASDGSYALRDYSDTVFSGGDRIHVIKVFEQRGVCDALLIESQGHFGMVDVGLPYDYQFNKAHDVDNSVVNYLMNYGVEKLDFIILTHMHNDHVGNLANVLRSFPVETVYARTFDLPDYLAMNPYIGRVASFCDQYRAKRAVLKDGQVIPFYGLNLKVFNLDDKYKTSKDDGGENNNCLGLLVTDEYGHKAFLAGDINNYDGDEDRMIKKHSDELSYVDYLKVGHHGGVGSSTYDFINMLNPMYVTVTGWRISEDEDPFRPGFSVWDNFTETRAYETGSIYFMFESANGIIFNMGEELSINNVFQTPSHFGDANKTLSIYYNANGGEIKETETRYYLDDKGMICGLDENDYASVDNVEKRSMKGDVVPMYYYDMDRSLPVADSFGLEKKGYTFSGKWVNMSNPTQKFSVKKKYSAFDLAPKIAKKSCTITLMAKWRANRYSLVFHANGGKGIMDTMQLKYDKAERLLRCGFERDGYVFEGWNTAADGSGKHYNDAQEVKNLSAVDGKSIILYAQWNKVSRRKVNAVAA